MLAQLLSDSPRIPIRFAVFAGKDMRECHIEPDWLLVYKVMKETLILRLIRTGSHSDLF